MKEININEIKNPFERWNAKIFRFINKFAFGYLIEIITCRYCGSTQVGRLPYIECKNGLYKRYKCMKCKRKFVTKEVELKSDPTSRAVLFG